MFRSFNFALIAAAMVSLATLEPCALAAPASGANANTFMIQSYQGRSRCLDYTTEVTGSPVFLNDCAVAHPVVVEELTDGTHAVVLHAGSKVIGIPFTMINGLGNAATPVAKEVPLQLFNMSISVISSGDHFFFLDGDS